MATLRHIDRYAFYIFYMLYVVANLSLLFSELYLGPGQTSIT